MDLYEKLSELNIEYKELCHKAVFTVEEAKAIEISLVGTGCKNLFLKSKEGRFYLVVLHESKRANIKEIEAMTESKQLRFANEEALMDIMGLKRGSVTPLGIINDGENKVEIIIDDQLKGQILLMHPNVNTKTISMKYDDLISFIEANGHH